MHLLRTRFKKDIVAEFLPPTKKSNKVIILCDGMPGVPSKRPLMEFFARKRFWVFHPRYRGSWESSGSFLKISPEQDILDVINHLPKGFVSLWDGKRFAVRPSAVYLVAGSFGGPAGILLSKDPRVKGVIAVSPVVDWTTRSKAEPLDFVARFTKSAFGEGYRFLMKDWNRLKTGKFYNPMNSIRTIRGDKIFIIHAKDDESVGWRSVAKFSKITGAELLLLKKGGHLSSLNVMKKRFYRRISGFLKKR